MSTIITEDKRKAFIIRMPDEPGKELSYSLQHNEINLGWERVENLLDDSLCYKDFREEIHQTYHAGDENYRNSGRDAKNAWRFLNEMSTGNYILIPENDHFYIGRVKGKAYFDDSLIKAERGYKRPIKWLNNKDPISYRKIPIKLRQKLKYSQKVTNADNLMQEIEFTLRII